MDYFRARKLRRLFDRQKNRLPSDMPDIMKNVRAADDMDALVGPEWREEIHKAEVSLLPRSVTDAPPRCGSEALARRATDQFYKRVRRALRDEDMGSGEEL